MRVCKPLWPEEFPAALPPALDVLAVLAVVVVADEATCEVVEVVLVDVVVGATLHKLC